MTGCVWPIRDLWCCEPLRNVRRGQSLCEQASSLGPIGFIKRDAVCAHRSLFGCRTKIRSDSSPIEPALPGIASINSAIAFFNFDCQFVPCTLAENEVSAGLHALDPGFRSLKVGATLHPKRISVGLGSENIKRCNHGVFPLEARNRPTGKTCF
jgi:hypothetical protein